VQTPGAGLQAASTRARPVWRLLSSALEAVRRPDGAVAVLDCGGGTGTFAVPLAQAGAAVTVVDVSVDALATLRRRASDAGVADRVRAVQADVESLPDDVRAGGFDLALAHGVLESVDDPESALRAVAGAVRPGGLASLLVANPDAGVLARALAGDLEGALGELRARAADGRFGPPRAVALCAALGLQVEAITGIGIFAELVPGSRAEGSADLMDELETVAATLAPYRDIAGRVHVLARRPAG
jgi:SAM-dependent methyltransferase